MSLVKCENCLKEFYDDEIIIKIERNISVNICPHCSAENKIIDIETIHLFFNRKFDFGILKNSDGLIFENNNYHKVIMENMKDYMKYLYNNNLSKKNKYGDITEKITVIEVKSNRELYFQMTYSEEEGIDYIEV